MWLKKIFAFKNYDVKLVKIQSAQSAFFILLNEQSALYNLTKFIYLGLS